MTLAVPKKVVTWRWTGALVVGGLLTGRGEETMGRSAGGLGDLVVSSAGISFYLVDFWFLCEVRNEYL